MHPLRSSLSISDSIVSHTDCTEPGLDESYSHYDHQQGIAGVVTVRLVEARELNVSSTWWTSKCNPFVVLLIGKHSKRSSTSHGNANPSWRKEILELPVQKLNLSTRKLGMNVRTRMRLEVWNEDGMTTRAVEAVGIRRGRMIGTGIVDFTQLVEGDADVVEQWVTIYSEENSADKVREIGLNEPSCGEVRVIISYEPVGMDPIIGDRVMLEGFGLYPTAILPPLESFVLTVKETNGKFLLGTYTTDSGFAAAIRLHRNCVFVVHRTGIFDSLITSMVLEPAEFIFATPLGKSVKEASMPFINAACTLSTPFIIAAKATVGTSLRASTAALSAVINQLANS